MRIYYLVYEEFKAAYLVDMSEKKNQQKTIETIKLRAEIFRNEMETISREEGLI